MCAAIDHHIAHVYPYKTVIFGQGVFHQVIEHAGFDPLVAARALESGEAGAMPDDGHRTGEAGGPESLDDIDKGIDLVKRCKDLGYQTTIKIMAISAATRETVSCRSFRL